MAQKTKQIQMGPEEMMKYVSDNKAVEITVSEQKNSFLLETKFIVKGIPFDNSIITLKTLKQNGVQPTVEILQNLNEQLDKKGLNGKNPKIAPLFDGVSEIMQKIFP